MRNEHCELVFGLRGSVQKSEVVFILIASSKLFDCSIRSVRFSFDCDVFSLILSSSHRFDIPMTQSDVGELSTAGFDRRGFLIVLNFVSFFSILENSLRFNQNSVSTTMSQTYIATSSETIELRFGASSFLFPLNSSIDRFLALFAAKLKADGGDRI